MTVHFSSHSNLPKLAILASMIVPMLASVAVINGSWAQEVKEIKTPKILTRVSRTPEPLDGFQQVEMFSAMESGQIEVRVVPSNSSHTKLIVVNNSEQPLSIQMPETFAGVPAMRQMGMGMGGMGGGMGGMGGGMGGMGGMGGGMGGMGMGGQGFGGGMGGMGGGMGGMGGGMGGMGGGMGGMGMGGGMFNIPVGKTGKLDLNIVCLEEGKPDPRPSKKYKIVPLELLNADPRVAELCRMLGTGEVPQPVAQAAAWHITDNKSWAELLVKNRRESMDGSFERYFHPTQVQMAPRIVVAATERAKLRIEIESQNSQKSGDAYSENAANAETAAGLSQSSRIGGQN